MLYYLWVLGYTISNTSLLTLIQIWLNVSYNFDISENYCSQYK